jgi:hypothetical protein
MPLRRSILVKSALSTLLLVLPMAPAAAQDVNAVAERLKAVLADQGAELSWTGISGDASEMVISGAAVAAKGGPDKITLGDITLSDIAEENGGYVVGEVALPNYSVTEEGATVTATGIEFTGLKLPAEGVTDPLAGLAMYHTADLESITVKLADKQVFSMDQLHFEISPPEDGKAMAFSGSAEKFSADLSVVQDPESRKVIDALGYSTIEGDYEMAGSWHPAEGTLEISQNDITVDNAGTFGIALAVEGYTADFVKSLQDVQKKIAAQPEGADNSAQGLAMLGLMQQLSFGWASVRFDDDSITGKVLDYVAAQQGMKAADLANQAKAILPFLMAKFNSPELTAQVTAAVSAYLDDPVSLEIAAEPGAAVPFAVILAGAMSQSPQDLVKTLAVTVTANED